MHKLLPLAVLALLTACTQSGQERQIAYDHLTDQDVTLAATTMQNALETGDDDITVVWQNPENGRAGSTTPLRTYVTDTGVFCREYLEVLVIDGEVAKFQNTACRSDAGSWVWLR